MINDMRERFEIAFCNEEAAGALEAVVLIAVFVIIASGLMAFLSEVLDFGKTRSGFSTTTGWFRTDDTTGMKN